MKTLTWEDCAVISAFYLEAAVKVVNIRSGSVLAVEAAAASESTTPKQARRLMAQAELMKRDPLGTYYGRHKDGSLQGEIRTPLEWPQHIPASEWQPVNDAIENMKLAHAAMQASFDLMDKIS